MAINSKILMEKIETRMLKPGDLRPRLGLCADRLNVGLHDFLPAPLEGSKDFLMKTALGNRLTHHRTDNVPSASQEPRTLCLNDAHRECGVADAKYQPVTYDTPHRYPRRGRPELCDRVVCDRCDARNWKNAMRALDWVEMGVCTDCRDAMLDEMDEDENDCAEYCTRNILKGPKFGICERCTNYNAHWWQNEIIAPAGIEFLRTYRKIARPALRRSTRIQRPNRGQDGERWAKMARKPKYPLCSCGKNPARHQRSGEADQFRVCMGCWNPPSLDAQGFETTAPTQSSWVRSRPDSDDGS